MVRRGELEFYDLNDRRETTDALKKQIRPLLVKELIGEPGMSDERLRRRIEKLADKPLDALMAS